MNKIKKWEWYVLVITTLVFAFAIIMLNLPSANLGRTARIFFNSPRPVISGEIIEENDIYLLIQKGRNEEVLVPISSIAYMEIKD